MNAPLPLQQQLDLHKKLIVDLFAGGGGMSEGIYMASGRHPDIAINHNDDALSMHRINHPDTRHFVADIFEVCPKTVTQGRPVGHLHLSPDCTHHSQAAGGQPRNEKIRALSWVGARWAGQVRPEVLTLENVKQVRDWCPLIAKRDKATGRVVRLDGTVAAKGERVPREFQYLIPDNRRRGSTWRRFIRILKGMGYEVADMNLVAADYGAGTTRERLFLQARCDGKSIQWPQKTHFKKPAKGQKKWRGACEFIDFTRESKSIFDRSKPLADATMRRIAKGIDRFVLKSGNPFIVPIAHYNSNDSVHDITEPLRTITAKPDGGSFSLVTPVLIQAGHGEGEGKTKRWGTGSKDIRDPLGTITGSGDQAIAAASLIQMGYGEAPGQLPRVLDIEQPLGTVTAGGRKHGLTLAHLAQFNTTGNGKPNVGHDIREPLSTIMSGGTTQGVVETHLTTLSPEDEEKALRVAAFLMSYYGTDNMSDVRDPLPTITTKDRLALVTVTYQGKSYVIVDIKLRMLAPPELYAAQGFPKHYIITHGHDGRKFTLTKQVKMCGNSVSPYPAAALYRACHQNDDMRLVA